jgi:GT2 family glycosyltransferase
VLSISVVFPTYQREQVLVDSIHCVLKQSVQPAEVLVIDQTPEHDAEVQRQLEEWSSKDAIRWIRLGEPSIPASMNLGLRAAKGDIVLFLDDDIQTGERLVAGHLDAYEEFPGATAVSGQVLQPGELAVPAIVDCPRSGLRADLAFPFYSSEGDWVSNVMAGNLSVRREAALATGGFDENFIGVAYRFETDFARRLIRAGGKIRFDPRASIHHLRAPSGGTRSEGSHLTSASPRHGMGDYYFAFLYGNGAESWRYSLDRMFREVRTRFHLRHTWWIPVKLLGEARALIAGWRMARARRNEIAIQERNDGRAA